MTKNDSQDTKSQILRSANRLLRRRSFNSFSYKDIADEIGIKKASIHYHFPTKEILGVETVKYYKHKIAEYIKKLENRTDNPVDHLAAYIQFFENMLNKNLMCPAGVLTMEISTVSEEMNKEISKLHKYYIEWLTKVVKNGCEQNKFIKLDDPEKQAKFISATIQGGMLLSRGLDDKETFRSVVDSLYNTILVREE